MNKGIGKLQLDGKAIESAIEIAEHFNSSFSSIADNLRSGHGNTQSDLSKLVNFVESCKDPDVVFSVPDITNAQVLQFIKGISPHKAAGIDKISARFLRIAAPILDPSIRKANQHVVFHRNLSYSLENRCRDTTVQTGCGQ